MNFKAHWNWIICGGLLAVTAGWCYFSFLPQRRAIAAVISEARQKEEHVLLSAGLPASLAEAEEELAATRAFNQQWRQRGIDSRRLTALYGRVHEAVQSSGATTTRLEPQSPESLDAIRRVRFTVGCSGTYRAVLESLARLEELDVPLRVESLQMSEAAEDGGNVVCEAKLVVFSGNVEKMN